MLGVVCTAIVLKEEVFECLIGMLEGVIVEGVTWWEELKEQGF